MKKERGRKWMKLSSSESDNFFSIKLAKSPYSMMSPFYFMRRTAAYAFYNCKICAFLIMARKIAEGYFKKKKKNSNKRDFSYQNEYET